MDGHGVKVTFIETRFVTSDAAGFKSLVQRLTGKPAGAGAARPPHRPRPSRAAADGGCVAGGRRRCYASSSTAGAAATAVNAGGAGAAGGATAPCPEELHGEICDFYELLYAGAVDRRHGGGGGYDSFPY